VVRLKCIFSYDGTNFAGFQYQPNQRTIAGELEKALAKMHRGEVLRVHGSGRTDAGVHAKGQVVHFDSPHDIPADKWKKALNALLPADIYVNQVEFVPETFHARFSAKKKEYHYFVWNGKEPNIFKRHTMYHVPEELNVDLVNEACRLLMGTHDFTTFSSAKATVKGSKVRTLYHARCERNGSELTFIFKGNGFLYNMVRILVGFLLDIGQGKRSPDEIPYLLEQKDRQFAGDTVPPQGLFLWKVHY
jgi:tRNA pseudouridine38-40 synthase